MTLRRLPLPLLVLLALCAVVLAVGAVLLAADWWICLPQGKVARYVGRNECARCHQKEVDLWKGSDHDRAMAPASSRTVRGEFDGRQFTHVAFEDLTKLSDRDLRTVLGHVEPAPWARALKDAPAQLKAKILGNMSRPAASRLTEQMENLEALRPCDVTQAQDQIVQIIRRLKDQRQITVDFSVTSTLFRRGEEFYVTTDGPTGEMEDFRIKYVFGVWPLQQYLIEFPDGRVQCLGIAWDTEKKRWFHLYPAETIPAGDQLHWTRPLQNWNYMCAECHTTNLQKQYDLKGNRYHTTWSEIDVSCETCHGPGSLHVELADSRGIFWDRRIGYGLPRLKDEDSRVEIETCAPCHSRRRVVYPGWKAGEKLLDYYLPEVLEGNLYYADGQVLEEDYVYGSFIQSRMYRKGIRCTDCHDPHTARVKFADLIGPRDQPIDNRLCTGCHIGTHPAGKYDSPAHHHHPDSSKPGTRCVECHMPETTYMVVDPRRDHSIRNPRPDLTVSLGIPNACNGCHHDRSKGETAEWAEQQLQDWYGKRKGPPHFAQAIADGRRGKPGGERALEALTRWKDTSGMVRASALLLLAGYPSQAGRTAALRGLRDPEALVRAAAVRSLQHLPEEELQQHLPPMLHDPIRAVRTEAARILSQVPRHALSEKDRRAFDAGLREYMIGQENVGDQPAAHLNVAIVHTNLGDLDRAEQEYHTALRLDSQFVPARINLAMLFDLQAQKAQQENRNADARKKKAAAVAQFRKVIGQEPELAEAHYSLGLLLAEQEDRLAEAAEFLATAARLAPQNARIHYNYGLALQRLERPDEAEEELKTAYRLAPGVPDYLNALTILYAQQKRWASAVKCAEELARRQPDDPRMRALLEYVQREATRKDAGGAVGDQ